jgi:hypothetical protein
MHACSANQLKCIAFNMSTGRLLHVDSLTCCIQFCKQLVLLAYTVMLQLQGDDTAISTIQSVMNSLRLFKQSYVLRSICYDIFIL